MNSDTQVSQDTRIKIYTARSAVGDFLNDICNVHKK